MRQAVTELSGDVKMIGKQNGEKFVGGSDGWVILFVSEIDARIFHGNRKLLVQDRRALTLSQAAILC
jgi:hypothetical protein